MADELSNQKVLNQDALDAENLEPIPDPIIVKALELNISAIPDRVWEERFKRPQSEEYTINPLINVIFANAPLNDLQTVSTQSGDDTFMIEVYAGDREPEETQDNEGDSLSSIKLQRCLAICRSILMNPNYQKLGFNTLPYFVGKVSAGSMQVSQPDEGADNTNNLIYGKFNLAVKISEIVEQVTGVLEGSSETTYKVSDEKGYFWTTESN
ncbi:hypothetical protein KAR91_68700 [Candidatus Pacearchaeota archaeon]|nr:hypothetical protein [Candidatus Pacearchaeota archaeon]